MKNTPSTPKIEVYLVISASLLIIIIFVVLSLWKMLDSDSPDWFAFNSKLARIDNTTQIGVHLASPMLKLARLKTSHLGP